MLDPTYKIEIPEQSDIKNQCSLGTCHLYSWVSLLEHDYKMLTKADIKISTHYLSALHWRRRSLEMLDSSGDDQVNVKMGAHVYASRRSILNSGIIPDEAWTGSRDFQSAPLAARITEYIKNITARAKWDISKQTDSVKAKAIREKARNEILAIFENLVGKIPTFFTFQGKEFTPTSFQKTYFSDLNKPITQIFVSPIRKARTSLDQSGQLFTIITTDLDTVESTTRKLLDHGQNVYISYEHNGQFVDAKSGVMSISAFDFPSGAGPLSRDQRAFFKTESNGHAVQIVGYDIDPRTNKVIKWKLKNSWGDKSGDHGYYHMYNDYFRAFITSISFFSNPDFTPKVIDKIPTQLDIF